MILFSHLIFEWKRHHVCDVIPLVSNRGFVHVQSVQLLHAAPADGYGGVGETDGSSLGSAWAAGRRQPLLAGDGGAAARTVTHRLSHTHLTERQLVCELMVLLENRRKCLMKASGLCTLRNVWSFVSSNRLSGGAVLTVVFSRQCSRWWCWCSKEDLFFRHRTLSLSRNWEIKTPESLFRAIL